MRGFFRYSMRDLLVLIGAIGLLFAVLTPTWHQYRAEAQAAKARRRLSQAISSSDADEAKRALDEEARWGGGQEPESHYQEIQKAVWVGNPQVLDAMIAAGCEVSHPTHLELAVKLNRPEMVKLLATKVADKHLEEATAFAIRHRKVESVEALLNAGAMGRLVDVTDQIFGIANADLLKIMRLLLERRKAARKSGHDDSEELAAALATVAVRWHDPQYAQLLIEYGAKPAMR